MLNDPQKETPAPVEEAGAKDQSSTSITIANSDEKSSALFNEPPIYEWPLRRIETPCPDGADRRETAMWLANAGFRVFRLFANEKRPIGGSHPFNDPADSTSDPGVADKWWSEPGRSSCNIGIRTDGRRLVVIDLDVHGLSLAEQKEGLTALCGGVLPLTWTVRTASGGWHLYFLIPQGALEPGGALANSISYLAPGIDVRAFHGLAVAPGSNTKKGSYAWEDGLAPWQVDIADIPAPLLERCLEKRASMTLVDEGEPHCDLDSDEVVSQTERWLPFAPEAAKGEGGRATTITVVQKLGDLGNSKDRIFELLAGEGGWNETHCSPPWEADRLYNLVHSLKRKYPRGCSLPSAMFECVPLDDDWRLDGFQRAKREGRPYKSIDDYTKALEDQAEERRAKARAKNGAAEGAASAGDGEDANWRESDSYFRVILPGELKAMLDNVALSAIDGYLDAVGTVCVYGDTQTWKTFGIIDMFDRLAAGEPWAGRATQRGVCVVFAAESPTSVAKRALAVKMARNRPDEHPLVVIPATPDLFKGGAEGKRKIVRTARKVAKKLGLPVRAIAIEPPRVCRRPQLLRGWGYGHEEDDEQIFG